MIKFLDGDAEERDSELVMDRVNRYIQSGIQNESLHCPDEKLHALLYEIDENLKRINTGYVVNPILDVEDPSKIRRFGKRIIRKLIQWCFDDMVARQVVYNTEIANYIESVTVLLTSLSDECILLKEENAELKFKLNEMMKNKNEK